MDQDLHYVLCKVWIAPVFEVFQKVEKRRIFKIALDCQFMQVVWRRQALDKLLATASAKRTLADNDLRTSNSTSNLSLLRFSSSSLGSRSSSFSLTANRGPVISSTGSEVTSGTAGAIVCADVRLEEPNKLSCPEGLSCGGVSAMFR